jgi:hypothetical protein
MVMFTRTWSKRCRTSTSRVTSGLRDQPRLVLGERLEQPAHELQVTLDRLVGVGDAAHVDRLAGQRRAHPVELLERVALDLHPAPPRRAALRVAAEDAA